jgi:hypothetical protein
MRRLTLLRCGIGLLGLTALASACGEETPGPGPDPVPDDDPPSITLIAPVGGEVVAPGSDLAIQWTATDDNGVVGVDVSYTHGGGGKTVAEGLTETSYTWRVPNVDLVSVRVHVVAWDSAGQKAEAESEMFGIITASARGYVSAEKCKQCHGSYFSELLASGHPYKLNKVTRDRAPTYPFSSVPTPPPGASRSTWSDVAYVIGGYGWKARFMTADSGWIMTNAMDGVNVQYNLPRADLGGPGGLPATWSSYQTGDTQRKPYNCGACHTTGWQTLAENGDVHQDGLPGIAGTWEETGIQCEECHGPGAPHVASQDPSDITVDQSDALCGRCHVRGDPQTTIPSSGGYIQHHEQYNELLASPHAGQAGCNDCHDPHIGVLYGHAAAGGIVQDCQNCHSETLDHEPVSCESCHMPRATKSARAVHLFEGDVRTHLFRINTNPLMTKDSMLAGGTSTPYVTLDFACYSCHTDPVSGQGGGGEALTMAELASKASQIH